MTTENQKLRTNLQSWEQSELRLGAPIVAAACAEAYKDDLDLHRLARWFHAYCSARSMTWKLICDRARVDHELAYRVWNGGAKDGDRAAFVKAVGPFRELCGKENRGAYARTSYSDAILKVLESAARRSLRGAGTLFFIQGDAGCGKSLVCSAWCEENIGQAYLWEIPGMGGLKGMVRDLAKIHGLHTNSNYDQMRHAIYSHFSRGDVLVADEAHLLANERDPRQSKIEGLRRISDIRRISIVMTFTADRFEKVIGKTNYNVQQLSRRFGRAIFLDWAPTDDDIRALFRFKCSHIPLGDGLFKALRAAVDHPMGGFGMIGRTIEDAEDTALDEERDVTAKDIAISLAKSLGGEGRQGTLTKLQRRMAA
jgi:hypothetical protein